jgi:hypothetical protein
LLSGKVEFDRIGSRVTAFVDNANTSVASQLE